MGMLEEMAREFDLEQVIAEFEAMTEDAECFLATAAAAEDKVQ